MKKNMKMIKYCYLGKPSIKKTVKVGISSQQEGGRSVGIPTSKQVFKKCLECPKTYNKHKKHFCIFRVGRSDT